MASSTPEIVQPVADVDTEGVKAPTTPPSKDVAEKTKKTREDKKKAHSESSDSFSHISSSEGDSSSSSDSSSGSDSDSGSSSGSDSEGSKKSKTKKSKSKSKKSKKASLAPAGSKCSVKHLVEYVMKNGDTKITEKNSKTKDKDPYKPFALVLKEVYNADNKLQTKTLQINSPQLLNALDEIVTYYPSEPLNFKENPSYEIKHPYMMLHHHFSAIKECANKQVKDTSADSVKHLQLLIDFLEEDGKEYRKLLESNLVDFKHLWCIYKPGELLFESDYGYDRLYRITRVGYNESPTQGKFLEIRCTFTSCDGEIGGTAGTRLKIYEREQFVGESATPITSLSTFPLSFLGSEEEQESVKTSLVQRGKQYLEIKGVTVYQYEGLHLYLKPPPDDYYNECADYSGTWLPATTHGRVVVDAKTFAEEARQKSESIFSWRRSGRDDDEDKDMALKDHTADPLLAPPHVFGFCLETKKWCKFFVDALQTPTWAPDALDSLVVPPHRKAVIRSLVSSHADHSSLVTIAGRGLKAGGATSRARNEALAKGKGLIVLLHGEPGSGKTLTAELMAEHTHRPLLNISTGELGSWEHRVSYELKRLLTYASIWKAIVLIDEADVFLESRQSGPTDMLAQNALVAVFLRQLEYFQGIAFLTSNRVAVFDAAVKSRIHLALKYDSPDATVRKNLWTKKLEGLPESEKDFEIDTLTAAVADAAMNGREISNSVNTARTLAKDQGTKVTKEHVETVVALWREFESVLASEKAALQAEKQS